MNLLKPNDVARQLSVSRAWVYEAARTGRIPSVRIGGEDGPLRFVPEEIDRWIMECRTPWATTAPSFDQKSVPRAATAQRTPSVNCPVELRRTATIALAGSSRRSRYRFLGRDGTRGENVALEVAVVPLGCADVGVAELPLDVHERVASREPCRGRCVA